MEGPTRPKTWIWEVISMVTDYGRHSWVRTWKHLLSTFPVSGTNFRAIVPEPTRCSIRCLSFPPNCLNPPFSLGSSFMLMLFPSHPWGPNSCLIGERDRLGGGVRSSLISSRCLIGDGVRLQTHLVPSSYSMMGI